jgi:putative ABC transport system permease protein
VGLNRLAWRALKARPLRTFLTMVGVALGVGVLSASLTIGAGLQSAIDRTVRDMVGNADLRVSAFLEGGLSPATVEAVRSTDGVAVVAPTIERQTFLEPLAGQSSGGAVTVLGVDPGPYFTLHPITLGAGLAFAGPDESSALVTAALAAEDGYTVGSSLSILGAGAPRHLKVVGILSGPGTVTGAAGRSVIIPVTTAGQVFGLDGVTWVDIGLAPGTRSNEVAAIFADRLTADPYLLASPTDIAAGLRASTADFQATIALVATIALFAGAFLIVNTLSMTFSERTREVGLLRAAGATRGQLVRFVLMGAIVMGLLGSLVGLVLGAGLGVALTGSVRAITGFPAAIDGLNRDSLAIALLVGLAITIAAAIEPAIRAARTSPVEALRARLDVPTARRGRTAWLVVVFVAVAALALVVWPPATGAAGADRAVAVYAILLISTLATPLLLPPLGRIIGVPLAMAFRLEERLARGSLARDRSRTATTVGALVVGLAMVVAIGWTSQAARERASAWLAEVVPGDEVVTSIRPIGPDEGAAGTLGALPGVRSVTRIGTFALAIRGLRTDAAAIVGADFLADGRLSFVAGDRATALEALDAGGAAILPRAFATRLGLGVGDRVTIALGGERTLTVRIVGIVARSIPGRGGESVLLGWGDASTALGVTGADLFAVRFAPDATASDRAGLESAAAGLALKASPLSRVQGAVTDALDRVFGLLDALALIAVLVAALGIVNTLGMGVMERVREIGILRAIGMTRRQASRMVVVEAGVLGGVGVIFGVLVGLAVGAVLLLFTGGFYPSIGLPWPTIGLVAVLGMALSAVAAYYPARLAAGISIVRAVVFE